MKKFFFCLCFASFLLPVIGEGILYESGDEDGKSYQKAPTSNIKKIKLSDKLPEILSPGQHIGLYLGKQEKNLLLEVGLIRSQEKQDSPISIRYNNKQLFKNILTNSYKVLRIPIPATYHEKEENILDLYNLGLTPIGIDYIRITKLDFQDLPSLKLCLENPQNAKKEVRKHFYRSWFNPVDKEAIQEAMKTSLKGGFIPAFLFSDFQQYKRKTADLQYFSDTVFMDVSKVPKDFSDIPFKTFYNNVGIINISSGIAGREIAEKLKKDLQQEKSSLPLAVYLTYHVSETEFLANKGHYNLLAALLAAVENKCYTILLSNQHFGNIGLYFDKDQQKKPTFYMLPYISQHFSLKSKSLPCLLLNTTTDPMKPINYGASIQGNSVIFTGISKSKEKLKLTLLVPWQGKTVMEKLSGSLPESNTTQPTSETVTLRPSGNGGILETELSPSNFHFIRLKKEGTEFPVYARKDSLPEPEMIKFNRTKTIVNKSIFTSDNNFILTTARTSKGIVEPYGPLKSKISVEITPATSAVFDKIKNLVPDEKNSSFITFETSQIKAGEKSGIDLAVKSTSLPKQLKGLGFWIRCHSSESRGKLLKFEYGYKQFSVSLKPNTWEYCFFPISKIVSGNLRCQYPASKTDLKLEFNGFSWISLENEAGQKNTIRNCQVINAKDKNQIELTLKGESGKYCEIRKRIALDFVPNQIKIKNLSSFDEKPKLEAVFYKHSGILEIKGLLPKEKEKSSVEMTISFAQKTLSKTD